MAARTGAAFLQGLRDERTVWLGGEKVEDVTEHPALKGAAHSLANLFDLQFEQADACLIPDAETGEQINVSHLLPRSPEDIERRRRCFEVYAEASVGLMGRTPDYLNVTFAGFAGTPSIWGAEGNEAYYQNLVSYQKQMAREDLSLTHTIIHPTVDRSERDFAGGDRDVPLHKVGETDRGIVVRGARVLATLAPFSDEIAVYPALPLPEDADAYALAFCVPMATPGLIFLCRDSAALQQQHFDKPLSTRFDEQDAFVIFDDVEVPRERLFIDGNLDVYNNALQKTWAPNVMQQCMIRAQTKLEFAWGLAARMADILNDTSNATQLLLGEIKSYASIVESACRLAEREARDYGDGYWFPIDRPYQPLRAWVPKWMPRVGEIMQVIGSHNLLAAPSRGQLDDETLRPLIDKYMHGANGVDAEARAAVFRLAWDFCGTALAARNELYERYYFGSAPRHMTLLHARAKRERADALVDAMLAEPN